MKKHPKRRISEKYNFVAYKSKIYEIVTNSDVSKTPLSLHIPLNIISFYGFSRLWHARCSPTSPSRRQHKAEARTHYSIIAVFFALTLFPPSLKLWRSTNFGGTGRSVPASGSPVSNVPSGPKGNCERSELI
jgi:hypothetical protein